jgi:hypothetical protein
LRIKILGVASDVAHANLYNDKGKKLAEVVIHNPVSNTVPVDVYQRKPKKNALELGVEYDLVRREESR